MPYIKTAVIVNPASANGATFKRWPEIASAFKKEGQDYVHSLTEGPGHATSLARKFLHEGYELVVSVGGDGTANEVVNGFFENGKIISEDAAYGYISTGTGGDLGRTIGSSKVMPEAVKSIVNGTQRRVDLGKVNFINKQGEDEIRYFINVAGLGLDGDTVDRVNRTSKFFGGFLSFLWGTLVSVALYRNKKMSITVDGKLICDEPVTTMVIGNGCYFGGGMKALPNAVIDDGYLDIMILHNLSKLNLLASLPKVYSGSHLNHPRITSIRGRVVEVVSPEYALLNLDGEQPGRAPARIEVLPGAINLKG
ncbi:MAG: diacylglycerol/lipid kinase family protein [Bacillota bacterium]